jgi:hypothetical protein
MIRILLQFYKTEAHYYGDSVAFYHELSVGFLPQVNGKFHYTENMFNLMDEENQKVFTEQFLFKPGDFFVVDKMDWSGSEFNVDHSFFLVEELDNGKSAFIDMNDIPTDDD